MASASKANPKNKIKLSANDEDKIQDKFKISSSIKKFGKLVNDKTSKEKMKPKNLNLNNNIINNNFFKNPSFNTSKSNNNNNNYKNNNDFSYTNKKNNHVLNSENNNVINNNINFSNNDINDNHSSQKLIKHKINLNNNNNNSPFNISNNSNPNLNFTLKPQRENNTNCNKKNSNFLQTNQFYLATEPENHTIDNFLSSSIRNIAIKKAPLNLESNTINVSNHKNIKSNNNVLKTIQNQNQKQKQTYEIFNTAGERTNDNYSLNNLELQFKKSTTILNSLNKPFSPNSNNNNNFSISNLNNSHSKQRSNSKNRINNIQASNLANARKNLAGSFVSKNSNIQMPLETYSSHNDFIEDFFCELQNYNNNNNNNTRQVSEDSEKLNFNKNKVLNIFENIFKNIITGQKPMESLDIEIKKKLSSYSEIWKKFLSYYEKNSIKIHAQKNASFINNIDFSTKNVINHNHNITNTEPCSNNKIKNKNDINNNKTNNNTNLNSVCDQNCYNNLKKELEEKFTNLMKKEVNKIKGILEQKEKIIEDLQNQIKIKNTCLSAEYMMQQESINNTNVKSKDFGTSNRLLSSENFSKNMKEKTTQKKVNADAQSLKNNLEASNQKNREKNKNKNLETNKILCGSSDQEEAEDIFLKKKLTDSIDEQTELLLYDQKQFIRERRLLLSENKSLFDKINEMEKLLNIQKEKEIKLMKLLFFLNKHGIPIDEIIQNHILTEKTGREENSQVMRESNLTPAGSYKSMESLMYLPITLEKATPFVKPQVIPVLDFTDINNNFNMEYDSGRKSNDFKNNKNEYKNFVHVNNNEISSSFIECNKIENESNYHNSIINDISKLDHKKNRGVDLKIDLKLLKNKDDAYLRTSLNENSELGNSLKKSLNKLKLNLNTNSKESFYSKEKSINAANLSPEINKIKKEHEINSNSNAKNLNSLNQNIISNHVQFTEFSNNMNLDKNNSDKSNSKNKHSNKSNNNNHQNSSLLNNPVCNDSSYKKKLMSNNKDDNYLLKSSSSINFTEQLSITKVNNDKLKLNLKESMKNKMKELIKNKNNNKQTINLAKSIDASPFREKELI